MKAFPIPSTFPIPRKSMLLAACGIAALCIAIFFRSTVPSVETVKPVHGPAVQAVYATGTVEATVMMPIAARNAARLMELNVDEGSEVKKDQELARLEDEDLQRSIDELQAREKFAREEYDRKQSLAEKGFAAKAVVDQAKADWEAAKAATKRALAQAAYMKLLAPADGLIIRRDGEIGQMIAANQPVFWMSCCAPLRVSAEVDEEDIALVKNGQEVLIRADAYPGQVFSGKVQAITPKGDPVARSYRVRIVFTEENPLRIGMTAETNIIISRREKALLVPTSAVDGDTVWLIKDHKLVRQAVEVGARGPEQTEIVKGIEDDDDVVLKPSTTLHEGGHARAVRVRADK